MATLTHAQQPVVKAMWLLPPEPPDYCATYRTIELPLGVALSGEQRNACRRVGDWHDAPLP